MFCNHLISGERAGRIARTRRADASHRQAQELASAARRNRRCKRRANKKSLCRSEISKQRGILVADRDRDQRAVRAGLQTRAQIVFALVVGGEIATRKRRLADMVDV